MRRLARRIGILLVLLATAALGGGYLYLRSSLPAYSGRLAIPGLASQVTVTRDGHGIPTIKAASEKAAYFALGFVHAQDRLWQMEQMRRAGAGRLSELLGARALPTDRLMRTLGLYRVAEANVAHLSDEARGALEAYAQGVNGYLATRSGALPPEFLVLGAAPEPWRPADSLVFGRIMAMRLAGNWREELVRARLRELLPPDRVDDLWAPAPPAPSASTPPIGRFADRMLDAIPDLLQPTLASNAWAIDGSRTATGKPILANDPHLGFEAPIIWYFARIEAPGLSVAGATVPGVPFHLLGHNRTLAWGITTTHGDTMDLFIEKPSDEGRYETPQGPEAFITRTETIKVKDAAAETLVVRSSRHGPVISDVLGAQAEGQILALSATAFREDDRTGEALYRMAKATDWPSFKDALRSFHSPQQNVMYADQSGTISLSVVGRVPNRKSGDGTLPQPGWEDGSGWTGLLPSDVLPQYVSPPDGAVVNANNKPVPDDYPHLLARHWPETYRAERIWALLNAKPKQAIVDSLAMQQDVVSGEALQLLPVLLGGLPKGDARIERVRAMLANWDGRMLRDRPEPLIFDGWLVALQSALVGEKLARLPAGLAGPRPYFIARVFQHSSGWCDNTQTSAVESCADLAAATLNKALDQLADRHGANPEKWRWGDEHKVRFEHPIFRFVPGLSAWTSIELETDGGDFTLNRGSFDPRSENPFQNRHGPGMRAVYDLQDLDASRFALATGQSGNPLSPHWDDLARPWRDGESFTFGGAVVDTLILDPIQ